MGFYEYVNNPDLTTYGKGKDKVDNRTKERQTLDNIINFTLYDVYTSDYLNNLYANSSIQEFKNLEEDIQIGVLKHILRAQAYSIKKAFYSFKSIALPYLGRLNYSKYKKLSYDIYFKYKDSAPIETIKLLIRTTITDYKRSDRRNINIEKLSTRKQLPVLDYNSIYFKRNYIDERYNNIRKEQGQFDL